MSTHQVLLFTDLVDSTALTARLGDTSSALLWDAHDRLARALIQQWNGREIDKSDGFMTLFARVDDAVSFAAAYHQALQALSPPLSARVGIHLGPVTLRHNDPDAVERGAKPLEVDGLAKPAAARVMALAIGGQTLLTDRARAALTSPGPWRTCSHGHWRLKGIDDPIELFEVGGPSAPFEPPPDSAKAYRVVRRDGSWQPLRAVRHTLPAERDSFVGRSSALQAIHGLFEGGARLVTVLGTGGCGKTRLALRYARTWLGDHPGGAWFCDLSLARDLDGIVQAMSQGLEVMLGKSDPVQQLGAAIAGRGPCLLLLDNLEQVVAHAEASVGRWLERAPQARLLVTSRSVLGIAGEHVLSLPPLPTAEAAALFRMRSAAVSDAFEPDARDRAALEPLMELLDGLPLAIELAAARTRVMPVHTLLRRMSERFTLLGVRGGRNDRQATLRSTIDWSWDLLSTAEQTTLAQLSVFEGSFTLAAAEAVIALGELPGAPWAGDALQALVEKSLVRNEPRPRFGMLRSVHDYAAEQLRRRGAAAVSECQARHWRHFAALDEHQATEQSCADIDNLMAAFRRSADAGDAAAAAACLVLSWAAINLTGPLAAILPLVDRAQRLQGMGPRERALVAWVTGKAHYRLGHGGTAVSAFEAGLAAAAESGDPAILSRLHCAIAEPLARSIGRGDAARVHLGHALREAESTDDRELHYLAWNGLGTFCFEASLLDEAAGHFERALEHARQLDHRRWIGGLLGNLGLVRHFQRQPSQAFAYYLEALDIATSEGDRQWTGNTLCNLGLLHYEQGQHAQAQEQLERALALASDQGHSRLQSTVLCNLGLVRRAVGDIGAAGNLFRQAADLAAELADHRLEAECRRYLAQSMAAQRDWDAARVEIGRSQTLSEGLQERLAQAMAQCDAVAIEAGSGNPVEAARLLAGAKALREAMPPTDAAALDDAIAAAERDAAQPDGAPPLNAC